MVSNSLVCLAGCYEITIKKISFDTGIDPKAVETTLQKFEKDEKIVYKNGFIIIKNYLKNQSLNDNMQKNVRNTIDQLPANLKQVYFKTVKPLRGFETLWKVEDEIEMENEAKTEDKMEGEYKGEGKIKSKLRPLSEIKNTGHTNKNSDGWNGFADRTLEQIRS